MNGDGGWVDVLVVAAGGGAGAAGRYLVGRSVQAASGLAFPVGTLFVNVLGCLAFGVLFAVFATRQAPARAQLLLMTGLLGGFTTFSAFSQETFDLLRAGRGSAAALNAGLSVAACLGASALGCWMGAALTSR